MINYELYYPAARQRNSNCFAICPSGDITANMWFRNHRLLHPNSAKPNFAYLPICYIKLPVESYEMITW